MVPNRRSFVHTGAMADPVDDEVTDRAHLDAEADQALVANAVSADVDSGRDAAAAERRARIVAAAYHAEYNTGRKERTAEEAKRNIVFRLAIICVGSVVLLAGLLMMIFPGPGIIVSLLGLGILAREFTWADRLMRTLRKKSHVDEVGRLPIWAQVGLGLMSITAAFAGVGYLVFLR